MDYASESVYFASLDSGSLPGQQFANIYLGASGLTKILRNGTIEWMRLFGSTTLQNSGQMVAFNQNTQGVFLSYYESSRRF